MASPLAEPQQQVDPRTGRVITTPDTTGPSDAEQITTQSNSWYDGGLDAPTRTLEQTQSVQLDNTAGLPVIAEDGTVSGLRRNPETGELYNAAGLPAPPRAPSATQQANQDALARYIKEIGAQDPEFVDPTRIPNPPAPDVYGQVMNRET